MLTADLVRASVSAREVRPQYIDVSDPANLALATTLLEIFEAHVGSPRRELDGALADYLGSGTAFLLHRGLAKLLRDRSELETSVDCDPADLRAAIFDLAARRYRDAESGVLRREEVFGALREPFALSPAEVERALYADLKEEQVLASFRSCAPEALLKRYNVALAQAVLLRALELEVRVGPQPAAVYRELFRSMKFHQLLYRVEGSAERGYTLRLDGPLSLFRASNRYGLKMALFLPTLLHLSDWQLSAEVEWGKRRAKKRFRLAPGDGLEPTGHLRGQWRPEELAWFVGQFEKLETGWDVAEGGALVDLGGQGFVIPDFRFTHRESGREGFLEVLGFWRRGAVARRLELLRERTMPNLILGISKELHIEEEELEGLPAEVYVFRSTPVAREVARRLEGLLRGP